MGAMITTPAEKPLKRRSTRVVTRPAVGPAKRYTEPNPSQGTLTIAPNRKNIRNDVVLQPRASAHHSDKEAMAKRPMAMVQASSCGRRRRNQRSRVLSPNATEMMADMAARAVFKVTPIKARGAPTEFVNVCTR